jgi:hypothetical protein
MVDRLISLLVALCLAFLVWLYARSRDQENLDNVPIPVQVLLAPAQAEHYDLEVTGPAQIQASFTGPPSRIRELRQMLRGGELKVDVVFTVPADRQAEARYLDTVRVAATDVHAPAGVTVTVLEGRNRIPVTLHRLVERTLPVTADLGRQDFVRQATCDPPQVVVRGPQEILDRLRAISTQPCVLPPLPDADPTQETKVTLAAALVEEVDGRPVHGTPAITRVEVTLQPRQRLYVLEDVPVFFLCPAGFALQPSFRSERGGRVALRVKGPALAEPPAVVAYIDLTRGKFKPGLYAGVPVRLQLPKDFQLAQEGPLSVDFKLAAIPVETAGRPAEGAAEPGE